MNDAVREHIAATRYDRAVGVVHLGFGAFHVHTKRSILTTIWKRQMIFDGVLLR